MAKGVLTVDIDESQLKAVLGFVIDERGEEPSKDKLLSVCADAGIGSLLTSRKLESLLSDLASIRSGKKEIVIAEGKPPVQAVDGIIDFTKFDFSDECTPDIANKIFEKNTTPVVYSITHTNKKVEKVHSKKNALPFIKPTEEKLVSWERVEQKEIVAVDTNMDGCGYVQRNEILAVIRPGRPGKSGTSILGKSIPTAKPEIVRLYTSNHIKMTGNTALSEEAGFVRHGKNWIELIPYREHAIEVFLSEDKVTCLLSVIPGTANAREVDIKKVDDQCETLGIPKDSLINKDSILKLIREAISGGKAVKRHPISKPADSIVRLNISGDSLKATLTVIKGRGEGKPTTLNDILDLFQKSSILVKNKEKIAKDFENFLSSGKRELLDYPVCEGKQPGKGIDGKLQFLVDFVTDEEHKKIIEKQLEARRNDTKIESMIEFPLDSVEKLAVVKKGTKIAKIIHAIQGADGEDIGGNPIPGSKGKEPELVIFENIARSSDFLTASSDGLLEIGTKDDSVLLRVRHVCDGKITITVSDDRMKAFLSLVQGDGGGEMVTKDTLTNAIGEAKIVKGVKEDVIQSIFKHLKPGDEITQLLIAEGRSTFSDTGLAPVFKVPIIGKSCEREVRKSELIAEIQSRKKETRAGYDVFGKTPDGPHLKQESLIAGENVSKKELPDGRIQYYAATAGRLVVDKNIVSIDNVRTIEGDLDAMTGDLQVPGSIHIKGNIASGIRLFAQKDISVDGDILAAVVSAGGSIVVRGDIKGGRKAIIRAKKKIEARSAREAHILAVGDIRMETECVRCNVKCNGKIFLGLEKSSISEGRIRASKGVEAFNIGTAGTRTEISFGQDYLILEKIEIQEKKIEKLKEDIDNIDRILSAANSGNGMSATELVNIRTVKFNSLKEIENIKKDVLHLRDKFELHFPGSEIIVHGKISAGTLIESHMRKLEIKKTGEKVIISFNQTNGWIEQSFFI